LTHDIRQHFHDLTEYKSPFGGSQSSGCDLSNTALPVFGIYCVIGRDIVAATLCTSVRILPGGPNLGWTFNCRGGDFDKMVYLRRCRPLSSESLSVHHLLLFFHLIRRFMGLTCSDELVMLDNHHVLESNCN
jgi:hypothetical protein